MLRVRSLFVFFLLLVMSCNVFAAKKIPAMVVAPFAQGVTLAAATKVDVNIVVQNNSSVNLTITNLVPQIPSGSIVNATIVDNNCGLLAPLESCNATAELTGLTKPGNENLNISVCAFNGSLCSRIQQPVVVTNAPLVGIAVTPINPSIISGTTQQFSATGLYSDNTVQDITNSVTWSSSDITKATISSQGLAAGVAAGVSTISAGMNGVSGSSTLTVKSATLTSITVIPVNPTISNGTTQQFHAVGIYSDNSHQNLTSLVTWNSSNQTIATIAQNGIATGKSVGSSTITASLNSVSGSASLTVTDATLSSITVTPTNPTLARGKTQQFTATGIYSDNTNKDLTNDVTWSTGSALIAIVGNQSAIKGLALARSVGTTSVTAKLGGVTGSTNFTVTDASLNTIFVSPTNQTLFAGETQQYKAFGIFSDFRVHDVTDSATWASSNTAVARISNARSSHGLATGIAAGTTTISATQSGVSGNATLTVNAITLVSIAVTPTTPTIANGTQQQFTATGTYSDSSTKDLTDVVTWSSSAASVAAISNVSGSEGLATSLAAGSTTISAIFEGVTGSTSLTVSAATLTSIAVTPANASIPEDTSGQYTATGTFSDLSTRVITNEVTWLSSNTSKATVSNALLSKGTVTGVAQGSATIRATKSGVIGSTTVNVIRVNIGDSLNGGKVACLGGGFNNLITANANNSTGIIWGGAGTVVNAQSDIDGQANTTRIISVLGAGTSYAAGVCAAYEIDSAGNSPCVGGNTCYNDWFLPSTNQIACLRSNRNQINGFDKENYWASTEYAASPNNNAWYITFANNGRPPATASKTNTYAVRCVRMINDFS